MICYVNVTANRTSGNSLIAREVLFLTKLQNCFLKYVINPVKAAATVRAEKSGTLTLCRDKHEDPDGHKAPLPDPPYCDVAGHWRN
ncbi:hypothetical protein ACEN2S_09350 [Phaeovulum sp. W22_SRMD_FR3]